MISKKTQYGLKALSYLAQQDKKGPVLIAEIAEEKSIPIKFLESILLDLRKAGLLESKKGKGGGYFLAQPPQKIKVSTVIRLLDGPIALVPCASLNFYKRCADCDEKSCGLNHLMREVRDATLTVLDTKTVADLALM
ncbi:RrF2 family transcriptional regulator [Flavihumibacter petaseus]|uniref:Putative Rrf2 family transcriptional regulator n=1 Tax=Flavihumibacter petaseus NBRC 106054 TaxID=1220578 RepID=A0A0E9N0Y6_9BACT|nr:Rrf2 family transcriptional regulator [Flavihumibacter petaseus]GAO43311.1 putative Rrf2 family transcriptional regulator [Flavihumibacter petaseus NBRC 106054]